MSANYIADMFFEGESQDSLEREIRRRYGPDAEIEWTRTGSDEQYAGIDALVSAGRRRVAVDAKCRCASSHKFGDVLIEVAQRHADTGEIVGKGWIDKDLDCDFVLYGWPEQEHWLWLPWRELQHAWRRCGHQWLAAYGERVANNGHYETVNVPVPIHALAVQIGLAVDAQPVPPGYEAVVADNTDDYLF